MLYKKLLVKSFTSSKMLQKNGPCAELKTGFKRKANSQLASNLSEKRGTPSDWDGINADIEFCVHSDLELLVLL